MAAAFQLQQPAYLRANELGMVPHVFFCGATARLSALLGHELLTASLTGMSDAVAAVTFWHGPCRLVRPTRSQEGG